jgi:ubiquitin-protein ligase
MGELAARLPLSFTASGEPPDRYQVRLDVNGLERTPDGEIRVRCEHRFSVYLASDYPRRAPVVAWQTPIFHPNILSPRDHGTACLGSWSPGEGLADLCRRLVEMVTYRSFSVDDALNRDAAQWVRARDLKPGADLRELALAA